MGFFHWILECIWPARCAGCNVLGTDVCARCLERLPRALGSRSDWIIAAASMEGLTEPLIYALKYKGMYRLATPLGDWLAGVIGLHRDTATMFGDNPLLVPVPLHAKRLRERGYNQAALLARRLATVSMMPIDEHALVRVRSTNSQVETHSREERLENMYGAFACPHPELIKGRDIILVDDVCTTGATLNDCARALRVAGAGSVHAIVLARK
jgi:ComF family protein